jgi:2-polyprenyl-3-methyl-5-hydroxy-6-metoxy-1,4-benzoquinol methylase
MTVGLDAATITAYDKSAASYAQDWHSQSPAADLHAAVLQYFHRGGRTADIGCGSGRDLAWLAANGFPCVGYDASEGLLVEARSRYPQLSFVISALPDLPDISNESFDNVLCETVIMHLPQSAIAPSVRRLSAIMRPGGMLYLTWRVTSEADRRDNEGRLYTAFDAAIVCDALNGADILLDEEVTSASSGKTIHRIVARKH